MKRHAAFLAIIGIFFSSHLVAQDQIALTRDEVSVLKKKLQGVAEALGKFPEGYIKEDEDFYLPTEAYRQPSGLFLPAAPSVTYRFGGGSEQKTKKSSKDFEKEYKKRMAEAQAKGDAQEMIKISQEMQKKAGEMQLESLDSSKEPVQVTIRFNAEASQAIDPDGVLFESQGVICMRIDHDEAQGSSRVVVFIDPVSLQNTKNLSRADMKMPEEGVKEKTRVLNVTVEMDGPADIVESWAKALAVKKVLAQIDGR